MGRCYPRPSPARHGQLLEGNFRALLALPMQGPLCLSFSVHLTRSGRPAAQQDSVLSSHVKWLGDEGPVL